MCCFARFLWVRRAVGAGWCDPRRLAFLWRHAVSPGDIARSIRSIPSNVKKLAPAWHFQTGDYEQGLQSTPIVIDGVLYLSTTHSQVFALDAATGKLIWQYKYPMPRGAGGNIQNRGVAVGAGKVFRRDLRRLHGRRSIRRPAWRSWKVGR